MFKNILIATDGSAHAYRALDAAAKIAASCNANLTILHILMHGSVPAGFHRMLEVENLGNTKKPVGNDRFVGYPDNLAIPLRDIDSQYDEAQYFDLLGETIVSDATKQAKKLGVTKLKSRIIKGDPVESILKTELENEIDLIVIGSRGLGSIKGLLLGSVAAKVIQLASCPCLSIK